MLKRKAKAQGAELISFDPIRFGDEDIKFKDSSQC